MPKLTIDQISGEELLFERVYADEILSTINEVSLEATGFDRNDAVALGNVSMDDGTRTFTHATNGGDIEYWRNGKRKRFSSSQAVVIPDVTGLYFIYYDATDTLVASTTPWSFSSGHVFVALTYWDADNGVSSGPMEERHGLMPWQVHQYLHNTAGSAYESGGTPTLTVDGDGSSDTHAELTSVSVIKFYDEDIHNISVTQSTLEVWWKNGASADWYHDTASAALVKTDGIGGRPYYNQFTGGSWQLTETSNNGFMLMHLFATNRTDDTNMFVLIMGENSYTTKAAANEAAETEMYQITTGSMPTAEFIEVASIIIECKDSFTNTYNARVVSTADGSDFIDFRSNVKVGVGASTTNHGSLTGLLDDDHPQYSLADGTRAFTGEVAGVTPTVDASLATKGYVDGVLHDPVTVTDSSEIDFTLTGQDLTASIKAGSIDETKLDVSTNASLDLADSALQPSAIGVTVQAHSSVLDNTTASFTTADETKLDGIEALAEVNNISDINATDLTDAGDTTLHYHAADRNRANHTGTQTASTISDFDTEVSNNTDVAANTAARHAAVTVTDSTEIDFTLVGQNITASLKSGSIDETKLDTSTNASLDLADSAVQPGTTPLFVGVRRTITTKTTTATLGTSDDLVICTTNAFTVTLPAVATALTGKVYDIVNRHDNGTNVITIDGNASETINGQLNWMIVAGQSLKIVNTGSQWLII